METQRGVQLRKSRHRITQNTAANDNSVTKKSKGYSAFAAQTRNQKWISVS